MTSERIPVGGDELRYPRHHILFLDLDGTVRYSRNPTGFINKPADVAIFEDAYKQMKRWRKAGWLLVGITNQAGPATGNAKFPEIVAAVTKTANLTSVMVKGKKEKRRLFSGIQICMHHPDDGCFCRKPKPGMIHQGAYNVLRLNNYFGVVRPQDCLMVGDRPEDRGCADAAGIGFMEAEQWRSGQDDRIKAMLDMPTANNTPGIEVKN